MNDNVAEIHRRNAATFSEKVAGVTDWDAPAPVEGWTARSVVEHLVTWLPGLLRANGVAFPDGPDVGADPAGAWEHQAAEVQKLLEDPARAGDSIDAPGMPGTVGEVISTFYSPDVFMHTWDLARATGQDDRLDEATAEGMYEGMLPSEDMLRSSGQFGPARGPLPEDADATDRLMSFIGRDPRWTPPA